MVLRDITLSTPFQNILLDEVLLNLAELEGEGETVRFWESPTPFIVLGRTGRVDQDVYIEKAQADGVPVLRRSSGGGTVIQGPGCWNYTFIISKNRDSELQDLRKSYRFILDKVISALARFHISAVFRPISDLAIEGSEKKFSGNAQKRGREFILHHGTILYRFDLSQIEQYLKIPLDIPEYRRGRQHLDFVTNIPVSIAALKQELKKIWGVRSEKNYLSAQEDGLLQEFLKSRNIFA